MCRIWQNRSLGPALQDLALAIQQRQPAQSHDAGSFAWIEPEAVQDLGRRQRQVILMPLTIMLDCKRAMLTAENTKRQNKVGFHEERHCYSLLTWQIRCSDRFAL
jgi:hypothetical protein